MKQYISEYIEAQSYKNQKLRIEKKIDGVWGLLNEINKKLDTLKES